MQASTIHLLLEQCAFPGRLQGSTDGLTFASIGRFPELRAGVPKDLWGIDSKDSHGVTPASGPAIEAAAAMTSGPAGSSVGGPRSGPHRERASFRPNHPPRQSSDPSGPGAAPLHPAVPAPRVDAPIVPAPRPRAFAREHLPAPENSAEAKRLAEVARRWKSRDHFEVLGLPRQCSDDDVKRAFNQLAKKYHPDRAATASAEVQELHKQLFERLRAAWAAIGKLNKRRLYVNELARAELRERPADKSPVDDGSRIALEKVRHLFKGRQYREATKLLDEALAANPGLAAGWAWRAMLKIFLSGSPETVRGEATTMIQRAVMMDPRSREVHMLAARVAKHYGDAGAFKHHQAQADALKKQ